MTARRSPENRIVVQHALGDPAQALRIEREAVPEPGPGEVLVELVLAPINPAELLMLRGQYGYWDTVPPVPRRTGVEGVGRVVGGAVDVVPEGTEVLLSGLPPVMADYRVAPADRLVALPPGAEAEQAAVSFINLQCVLLNLRHPSLQREGWLIQNAANSAYGRAVDKVAHRKGYRVVNVVRSEQAAAELADAAGPVVVDGPDLRERVLEQTAGAEPTLALDAVAGASTGRLADTLAAGSTVLTYGLLSGQPCSVDTRLVVFRGITLAGFWLPQARAETPSELLGQISREALDLAAEGVAAVPVAARYGLDDAVRAFEHADRSGRNGKIVVVR